MDPIFAIVSSGTNVSGDLDLRKRRLVGVYVPSVSSAALALQGNFDTTSANFFRFLETRSPGSGDLLLACGVGSRFLPLSGFDTPPYMRLEFVTSAGSFQTDNRTMTLLTR